MLTRKVTLYKCPVCDLQVMESPTWKHCNQCEQDSKKHPGYKDLLEKQGGVCAICNQVDGPRALAQDHNHSSGKIRGLLCMRCNVLIGFARENLAILASATKYLNDYNYTT